MSSRKNKINMVRRHDLKWEGAGEEDEGKLNRFGIGEVVVFTYTVVRSYINLQRFFVMIKIGFDNQEEYTDIDLYRDVVQMEGGFYDEVTLFHEKKKFTRRWPKSIAYENLEEAGFTDLQEKVSDVISKRLGIKKKELQEEVIRLGYSHS